MGWGIAWASAAGLAKQKRFAVLRLRGDDKRSIACGCGNAAHKRVDAQRILNRSTLGPQPIGQATWAI